MKNKAHYTHEGLEQIKKIKSGMKTVVGGNEYRMFS
jgi:hypothetical protein